LLCLFVAWDLLGFTSFFLVIFYRSRASIAGGLLTGLTNRLGDVFLLAFFGTMAFGERSGGSWALYLLLVVSFTKSAQVPFCAWLPAAMLAPTPVSALVHSSTLVTAGVYLLYRYSPTGFGCLIIVGVLTTLVAGSAALLEVDVKKIVAYSTISQLGVMLRSLGLGERSACFAHLNTHASFKALIFLVVGTLIHSVFGSQEARAPGLLHSVSPFLLLVLAGALASMCGLSFLSGWLSKEAILESRFSSWSRVVFLVLFYAGLGLTLLYSLRLVTLLATSNGHGLSYSCSGRLPLPVSAPLLFLFITCLVQGEALFGGNVTAPLVVFSSDKFVVWAVFLCSFLYFFLLRGSSTVGVSPARRLGVSTLAFAYLSCPSRLLFQTEVVSLQGGGLGMLPSLARSSWLGSFTFAKAMVCLSVVCFLV